MSEAFLAINAGAWTVQGSPGEVEASLKALAMINERMADLPPDAPKMMILLAPVVAMFVGDDARAGALTNRALQHEDPWIAAAVRTFRAAMAENLGDAAAMRVDAETALAAFRALGERWGMTNSLQVLGQLEVVEGNLAAAAAAYREGLELASAIGSREDIAMMRLRLADILTRMGEVEESARQAELARAAAELSGSPIEVLFTRIFRVEIARSSGDLETAGRLRDEAILALREMPTAHPVQGHGLAVILSSAAKIDLDVGDLNAARVRLDEAYEVAITTKDMSVVAMVGVAVAMLAAAEDQPAAAAEILGATAQIRGAEDATQLDIVALDARLGGLNDGQYAANYAKGKALAREGAVARVDPATI
jgi:ATP/maltotriose-dependent transcriptional regulator MalT